MKVEKGRNTSDVEWPMVAMVALVVGEVVVVAVVVLVMNILVAFAIVNVGKICCSGRDWKRLKLQLRLSCKWSCKLQVVNRL